MDDPRGDHRYQYMKPKIDSDWALKEVFLEISEISGLFTRKKAQDKILSARKDLRDFEVRNSFYSLSSIKIIEHRSSLSGEVIGFVISESEWVKALKQDILWDEKKESLKELRGDELFDYISKFKERGEHYLAEYLLKHALTQNANDSKAWNELGDSYNRISQYDYSENAIDSIKKAVNIEPQFYEAWFNLGYTYHAKGRFEDAFRAYKKALEIEPQNINLLIHLGLVYAGMKQIDDAVTMYNQIFKLDSRNTTALYNLGSLYFDIELYEKGIDVLKKAIKIDSDYAEALYKLSATYNKIGGASKAIKVFKEAYSKKPFCMKRDGKFLTPEAINTFKIKKRVDCPYCGMLVQQEDVNNDTETLIKIFYENDSTVVRKRRELSLKSRILRANADIRSKNAIPIENEKSEVADRQTRCYTCGAIIEKGEEIQNYGKNVFCNKCYRHCSPCGEAGIESLYRNADIIDVGGKDYCKRCFEQEFETTLIMRSISDIDQRSQKGDINVKGRVKQISKGEGKLAASFYLEDDSGMIRVVLYRNTGPHSILNDPKFVEGSYISVKRCMPYFDKDTNKFQLRFDSDTDIVFLTSSHDFYKYL